MPDPHRVLRLHRAPIAVAVSALVALGVAACGNGSSREGAADASPAPSSAPSTTDPSGDPTDPSTQSSAPSTPTKPGASPTTSPTDLPTEPPTATASPTSPTSPAVGPGDTLREGVKAPYVQQVQQQLDNLGYFVGTADGSYGAQTAQAVMALQKAAGLGRDGVFGKQTAEALADRVRPKPRTTSGSAVEVDLDRQLVMVVVDGRLRYTLNTSTGSNKPYVSDGKTYIATTPTGRFTVQRQIDGKRVSRLGELWRPKYFTGGWALHGAPVIPGYPASHGCARLSNAAIDLLWSSGTAPIGRTVWVY